MRMAGLACVGGLAGCQSESGPTPEPAALAPTPDREDDAGSLRTIDAEYARAEQPSEAYDAVRAELQQSIFTQIIGGRLEVDEISGMASFDGGDVLAGDFDPDTIAEKLQSRGYERKGTYRNHDLFEAGGEAETIVAIGDFTVRGTRPSFYSADPIDIVRASLDAAIADNNRWIEASDKIGVAFDALGDGYDRNVEVNPPGDGHVIVGRGTAINVVDGRERKRGCLVFENRAERERFDNEEIKQRFFGGEPNEEEVRADGRTLIYDRYFE